MKFDFALLRRGVDELAGGLANVRTELDRLRAERAAIADAPPAKAEIIAAYSAWVQASQKLQERGLRRAIETLARRPGAVLDGNLVAKSIGCFSTASAGPEEMLGSTNIDASLCHVFGPQLVEAFGRVLDNMQLTHGLPMEQRAVKLAELDRRIVQLEGQEAELIETAAGAGIALA